MEGGTFRYANPDLIHWGPGCVAARLVPTLEALGARRVFLVTTRSVAANAALGGSLRSLLGERLVGETTIGQHAPAADVARGAAAARAARPDALVSLGGGSPIDAAKAIALALGTGLDVREPDAVARSRALDLAPDALLPHLAVPTTLSVAELASGAGFTAEGTGEKLGLRVAALMPRAVFYDGRLAVETHLDLWLSTGMRAVDHAVEGILAEGEHPFSDTLSLEGLRRLERGLRRARENPRDADARTEGQLGAWFAYTLPGPAASGLSHTLGKRLGSRHGIPHGVTSCLLLPHVLRYRAQAAPERQAAIASALGADPGQSAADAVAALVARLELPRHLGAYGLSDADLAEAVAPLASAEHSAEALLAILRAAW